VGPAATRAAATERAATRYAAAVSHPAAQRGRLRLDILGAGPAYSDRPGATGAAYLVRRDDTAVCLDLGQGAFTRLAGTIEPSRLTAVVISHLHPDHFIDLVPLRHYLRWERRPSGRVQVIGPRSLGERIDALHAEPGFTAAALDVEVVQPGTLTLGGLVLEAARITHTADSYGYRVSVADDDEGPGLVYSGDCGRAEDLDPLVRPGDTLLSEVSFGPGPVVPGAAHLDGPMVAGLATRTRAGRVLLTHLQMGYDVAETIASVRAGFDGPVELVSPGEVIDLP
jgi:ribonuclease BN (tRNA processing enzyme)